MKKINVIGTSGSGKSRFSQQLAEALAYPHIQLDQINWQNDWQEQEAKIFREKLSATLDREHWVLDGNFNSRCVDIKWRNVDTLIWIDYSFYRTLKQAVFRALKRIYREEKLWGTNNQEDLGRLFSKDSIIWWTLTTYRKNVLAYEAVFSSAEYQHLNLIRLTSPEKCCQFIEQLGRRY